jgi:choline dehydrogenase-like flavoprotein
MPGFRTPDAVVIGGGATGLVVAHELTDRGLGVVLLEAGAWQQPQQDLSGDLTEMLHPVDGRWRWGPSDRAQAPWPRALEGLAAAPQIAAVGGLDLAGWGARPRAFVGSIEDGWPLRYADLVPWYERIEELLPVRVPDLLAPKDQRFVDACTSLRLGHLEGPDVDRVGWRLQPNAILPLAEHVPGTEDRYPAIDGCTGCGGCIVGCRNPEGAPIERTAKRSAAVALAPAAWASGRLDLRTGAVATRLLHEATDDGARRVRGVVYRTEDGALVEQDADTVVLCLGAIETPRLVLASGLGVPGAGRGLTCHLMDLVSGALPDPIDPSLGSVSMARCDFPGNGSIFTLGLEPALFAIVSSLGDAAMRSSGPWATSGASIGPALKRRLEAWPRTLMLGISVDDRSRAGNGVRLHPDITDAHGAIPRIRYEADDDSVRRRDWLARRAGEILLEAGAEPGSIHRADAPATLIHAHGTMRMGVDPGSSVTAPDGRLHGTTNCFIADTSTFPNAIGGADPALTAQALAARTAHLLAERHEGRPPRSLT